MALPTQLFRVNLNTLRESFVWQCSSQLFLSGLKVGVPIVMVPTNLVNGLDDTWRLFRSVVVINNYASGQLTFSDLIKLKHHILVGVGPVKECEVDAFYMHFRQFQPSVALVE